MEGHKGIECDVITGGFPCQDISNAGKRKGITGERSGLWKEMLHTIRMVGPEFVLVENVPALRNRGLGVVLGGLADSGYDTEWKCVQPAHVCAPHNRERIFILGNARHDGQFAAEKRNGTVEGSDCCAARQDKAGEPTGPGSEHSELADTFIFGCTQGKTGHDAEHDRPKPCADGEHISHAVQGRCEQTAEEQSFSADEVADAHSNQLQEPGKLQNEIHITERDWWLVEPDVGRVVDGFSGRVDRIKCLGNAVVPQVAEAIGNMMR